MAGGLSTEFTVAIDGSRWGSARRLNFKALFVHGTLLALMTARAGKRQKMIAPELLHWTLAFFIHQEVGKMKHCLRNMAAAVALSVAAAGAAHAASVSVQFPTSSATVVGSVGFINPTQIGYFWSVQRGDLVSQAYFATGLFNPSSLSMDLDVVSNNLAPGQSVDWDVLVNNVDVGDWSWSSTDGTGLTNIALAFAPIVGEFSSLALVVKNEVPSGDGSISLRLDTTTTVSNEAPEPGTLLLLGLTLAGLATTRRR